MEDTFNLGVWETRAFEQEAQIFIDSLTMANSLSFQVVYQPSRAARHISG